jgi:hypothetical protein
MTMALHWFPTARDVWEIPLSLGHLLLLTAGLSGFDVLSIPMMRLILLIELEFLLTAFYLWPFYVFYCRHIMFFVYIICAWTSGLLKTLDFE